MTIFGQCIKCNIAFDIDFGYDGMLQMQNCGTTCPKCGGEADIVDGAYHHKDGELIGVTGSFLGAELAERLKGVIKKAKQKKSDSIELLADIADVSPGLAEKLKSKVNFPSLVMILILIWLIKSVELNVTVDVNKLIDQAAGAVGEKSEEDIDFDRYPLPEEVIVRQQTRPVKAPKFTGVPAAQTGNRKERRRLAALQKRQNRRL